MGHAVYVAFGILPFLRRHYSTLSDECDALVDHLSMLINVLAVISHSLGQGVSFFKSLSSLPTTPLALSSAPFTFFPLFLFSRLFSLTVALPYESD